MSRPTTTTLNRVSRHPHRTSVARSFERLRAHPALALSHLLVAGLVIFVATWRLGVADAAPDEYTYRTCAREYLSGVFTCNREHPPLVKEILALGISLGHATLADARLITALAAIATAFFCYLFVTDVTDRVGGLFAAALWGLLPQLGREGSSSLEVIRIDRYALIDPFLAALFAMALALTWRYISRGGRGYALVTGAALMLLPLAKAPGAAIAVVLGCFALGARRREEARLITPLFLLIGALVVFASVYAPLGIHGTEQQLSYMLHFKFNRAVVVAGHLYQRTPWWADLSFAAAGIGLAPLIVLGCFGLSGLLRRTLPVAMALSSALALMLFVAFGVHLSSPTYYVEWEPGLIVAGAIGLRSLTIAPPIKLPLISVPLLLGAVIILCTAMVTDLVDLTAISPGPYATSAAKMHCTTPCVVDYVAYNNIPVSYTEATMTLLLEPPVGHRQLRHNPRYVAIDPALFLIHPGWRKIVNRFIAHAASLGYQRVTTGTRIELFTQLGSSHTAATPTTSGP